MNRFLALILIVSSAAALSACIPGQETTEPANPEVHEMGEMQQAEPQGNQDTTDETAADEGTVIDYSLEMSNYQFSPNVISAQPGQTVRVHLISSEGMHDFVIDELNVSSAMLLEGEEEVIEFTIPEDASGNEYEFYCSMGDHRAMGMVGTLIVE